jgi:hypothetical protein
MKNVPRYVVRRVISVLGQQREGDITLTKLTGSVNVTE